MQNEIIHTNYFLISLLFNTQVPKVYWKNSTHRVLFMEYIKGAIVDDTDYIRKHNMDVDDVRTIKMFVTFIQQFFFFFFNSNA